MQKLPSTTHPSHQRRVRVQIIHDCLQKLFPINHLSKFQGRRLCDRTGLRAKTSFPCGFQKMTVLSYKKAQLGTMPRSGRSDMQSLGKDASWVGRSAMRIQKYIPPWRRSACAIRTLKVESGDNSHPKQPETKNATSAPEACCPLVQAISKPPECFVASVPFHKQDICAHQCESAQSSPKSPGSISRLERQTGSGQEALLQEHYPKPSQLQCLPRTLGKNKKT